MAYLKRTVYREQEAARQRRKRARQRDEQPMAGRKHPFGKVHVNNGGKALCKNRGDSLALVSKDEFEKINPAGRCGTCERLAGLQPGASEIDMLSEKQKGLLREIYEKTDNGATDKWCLTMLLNRDSNDPASTSLYRSLRRLQKRGLIEKRQTEQKRAEVRLVPDRVHVLDSGQIVVLNKMGPAGPTLYCQ